VGGPRVPFFQCFVLGGISPNFDLKNMISTYTKDFPWKKTMALIRQIFGKKKIKKSPDVYDKFQKVAKNIEGFWFLFYFHM
jgi:hypothetical protein